MLTRAHCRLRTYLPGHCSDGSRGALANLLSGLSAHVLDERALLTKPCLSHVAQLTQQPPDSNERACLHLSPNHAHFSWRLRPRTVPSPANDLAGKLKARPFAPVLMYNTPEKHFLSSLMV